MTSIRKLRSTYTSSARAAGFSRRLRAVYGRYNGVSYDTTAPGGLGLIYVTLEAGSSTAATVALNQSSVSTGGTKIWVDVNERKQLVITGERYE